MRQDIEFDAEGTTLQGVAVRPRRGVRPRAGDRDVPRLQRGQGAVPGCVRRCLLRCRVLRTALRQPKPRGAATASRDRRSIRGRRSATPGRDHVCPYARRGRRDRIGIWGSSYSGAHVLVVGALDRRVKCAVSQVPLISGHANARRLVRADLIAAAQEMFVADREARSGGEPPGMIRWSRPKASPPRSRQPDSYEWFTSSGERARRRGCNE